MFGPHILITFIRLFFKLPNNIWKVLLTDIYDGITWLFHLCSLTLAVRPREVTNHFPDLPKLSFDCEDVILIFSRLSNFNDMSKVTQFSQPLISLYFLTLRLPQFFIFTAENNFYSPVKFSSQNAFRVEKLW